LIRSTRATALVWVLGSAALLPLIAASCQKVIGLPDEQPTYSGGGAGAPKPVKASPKCMDYCAVATTACMADPVKGAIYGSEADCRRFCNTLEAKPEQYAFTVGEETMDPIACRRLKLDSTEPTACAQGSPTGAAECGNMCELYCSLYRDKCTDYCADNPKKCTVPPDDGCKAQCESLRVDGKTASEPYTMKNGE